MDYTTVSFHRKGSWTEALFLELPGVFEPVILFFKPSVRTRHQGETWWVGELELDCLDGDGNIFTSDWEIYRILAQLKPKIEGPIDSPESFEEYWGQPRSISLFRCPFCNEFLRWSTTHSESPRYILGCPNCHSAGPSKVDPSEAVFAHHGFDLAKEKPPSICGWCKSGKAKLGYHETYSPWREKTWFFACNACKGKGPIGPSKKQATDKWKGIHEWKLPRLSNYWP